MHSVSSGAPAGRTAAVARGYVPSWVIVSPSPVLVATAHGTRSAAGRATVDALVDLVRTRRPDLDIRTAFVDVSPPFLSDVVAGVDQPLVVVPVLLSRGFHVRVDIPAALAGRTNARATRPLGPDRRISRAMAERLTEARGDGVPPGRQIALVSTGTSDKGGTDDLHAAAADLAALLDTPVHPAVLGGLGVMFTETLAGLDPREVDVVPYLLAEGVFADQLRAQARAAGVRTVAGPIGAHPFLADLIVARYEAALAPAETGRRGR